MLPNLPNPPNCLELKASQLQKLAGAYQHNAFSPDSSKKPLEDIKEALGKSMGLANTNLTNHKAYVDKLSARAMSIAPKE